LIDIASPTRVISGGTADYFTYPVSQDGPVQFEADDGADVDTGELGEIVIEEIKLAAHMIERLQAATIAGDKLPDLIRDRLHSPICGPPELTPGQRLSLDLFLATQHAPQDTYTKAREAILRAHPEDELLTYHGCLTLMENITGIVAVKDDMCVNSCVAFTGDYEHLDTCPKEGCGEFRYDQAILASSKGKKLVPRKQMVTYPLGPQIQAIRRSKEGSAMMSYRQRCTDALTSGVSDPSVITDFFQSNEYLNHLEAGHIAPHDIVIMLSIDGCQLYRYKASDCWIWIWIILDIAPESRYKKKYVLIGGAAPGPNKIGNADTFLFRSLYHVCAIMNEGFRYWDAVSKSVFLSNLFLALATADGPGLAMLNGLCGHQGIHGCRLFCGMPGRLMPGSKTYYPAHLTPMLPPNYAEIAPMSAHNDVVPHSLVAADSQRYFSALALLKNAQSNRDYANIRKLTGIVKPSIFLGIPRNHSLGVPRIFTIDTMHWGALNMTALFLSLFRGNLKCAETDDMSTWKFAFLQDADDWKAHGAWVGSTSQYLPGCMHRPPRDIAKYDTSGYRAGEFNQWAWNLMPAYALGRLPKPYFCNYCKATSAIRIFYQTISSEAQRVKAHKLYLEFVHEFEELYYQRRADRLHFCRPCVHTGVHAVREIEAVGPLPLYSQYTMERSIGILEQDIRQHTSFYANLMQKGLLMAQTNGLSSLFPDLAPNTALKIPRGAQHVGQGYYILRRRERTPHMVHPIERDAIVDGLNLWHASWGNIWKSSQPHSRHEPKIQRWARASLPNGHICRSVYKDGRNIRQARNIKVSIIIY
jgi:hypothetical protein